jgi:hypothetical protein
LSDPSGGAGASRSSSSDTLIECQTIQAATWLVALIAMLTIQRTLRRPRYNTLLTACHTKNVLFAGILRVCGGANLHGDRCRQCAF